MNYLKTLSQEEINTCFTTREGEQRLGQKVVTLGKEDFKTALANSNVRFVLLGIPEDIGVRANHGMPGTAGFWQPFLKTFLNIQSNTFLSGNNMLIAGEVNCDDLMLQSQDQDPLVLAGLVSEIDKRVEAILTEIFISKKIPVVIGGGHNNAYPIIKAAYKALNKKISVINIDPHADLRKPEGRHSGNGFSYAYHENLIEQYLQVGLHENYNNAYIMDLYAGNRANLGFYSFDDYLKGEWDADTLKQRITDTYRNVLTGLEIDADSIAGMPSSAITPTAFTANEIRKLSMMITRITQPVYLHFPEAIPSTHPFNSMKMAAYIVSDFIKTLSEV